MGCEIAYNSRRIKGEFSCLVSTASLNLSLLRNVAFLVSRITQVYTREGRE